jgi:hypothetical protein
VTEQLSAPIGRPSKYDPDFCDDIVKVMGTGLSKTAWAGSIGVCHDTVIEWAKVHPEFSDAVKRGQAARTLKLEQDLLSGTEGPRITSRIFALKNAAPNEWREKVETEHSGNVHTVVERRIVRSGD